MVQAKDEIRHWDTERAMGRDGGGGRNNLFLFKMPFPLRLLAMLHQSWNVLTNFS